MNWPQSWRSLWEIKQITWNTETIPGSTVAIDSAGNRDQLIPEKGHYKAPQEVGTKGKVKDSLCYSEARDCWEGEDLTELRWVEKEECTSWLEETQENHMRKWHFLSTYKNVSLPYHGHWLSVLPPSIILYLLAFPPLLLHAFAYPKAFFWKVYPTHTILYSRSVEGTDLDSSLEPSVPFIHSLNRYPYTSWSINGR